MPKSSYENPGKLFIEKFGVPHDIDDVIRYTDFLRKEAGVSDQPPVDLTKIYRRFGIKSQQAPLVEQQGVSDGVFGFMLIKEDDPCTRQRFSEAHELVEFLFHQYKGLPEWHHSYYATHHTTKEKLCRKGAAALLMPQGSFVPAMQEKGFSFESASNLASLYETSLLATIYRMLSECEKECLLLIWRFALKRTQEVSLAQPSLFGDSWKMMPQKKLRIWWPVVSAGVNKVFIPANQSIPDDSIIVTAYKNGKLQNGVEYFNLQGINGRYNVEAKRVNIGDEMCVFSLLHR